MAGGGAEVVDAMALSDWRQAYDRLSSRAPATLSRDDLELLAEAAFWLGRPRESIAARERVYAVDRDACRQDRAAMTAWRATPTPFDLDETAVAHGWLKRAELHAAERQGSVEEGYVTLGWSEWALYSGDLDEGLARARNAVEVGRRHGDHDLVTLGQANQGRILVARGEVSDGIALFDEAMVAAVGGELTPFVTGWVYCLLLDTCQELGDLRRAAEWTELAIRWCERRGQESWYPGLCRLHRCEVQSLRGQWTVAEREALRAAEELAVFGDYLVADSWYLAGEIRRRKGELTEAAQAFRRAHELGRDPQPGLALLRLARGDAIGAATTLRVALAGGRQRPLRRGQLLAAHVTAALRTEDIESAAESAGALAELAEITGVLMLRGMSARAQGAVLLARGDIDAALPFLREAYAICKDLSCPYEAAEARLLMGTAARHAGDEETARLEYEAAAAEFDRLGAAPDAERAAALAARASSRPKGLTDREVEVLGLVAHGRTNREIAVALVISEHTVARHLSNIFRKLGVASRSAATAFAFEHDLA